MRLLLQLVLAAACLLLALPGATAACDYSACVTDAASDEGAFVECDMCVCDDFDDAFGGSGTCSTSSDDLFDCYIKYNANDSTWSCTLRMKLAWLIAFIVLGCCFCSCVCGLGAWCSHNACQSCSDSGNSTAGDRSYLMSNSK